MLPNAEERVLTTLNVDGSRRWLNPKLYPGRFFKLRLGIALALILIYLIVPFIKINQKPLLLLDVVSRKFTIFGKVFLPTDTLLLSLLMVGGILTIFLMTAIFGRVWCGYACPQTVYMEFIFRPLDRLFDAKKGLGKQLGGFAAILKFLSFLLIALILAHIFLSYFVSPHELVQWISMSPWQHPSAFLIVAFTTIAIMFDFGYFREQTCLIACPYGRLQSVLVDRHSSIISYDYKRGEPRKGTKNAEGEGDCVNCQKCVVTCPTGIDIREGLKMECIACTQCVDACDSTMDKVGKPRGLIRYASQASIDGEKVKFLRPRIIIYPLILAIIASVFVSLLLNKENTDIKLLRGMGMPFMQLQEERISNSLRIKITNRSDKEQQYTLSFQAFAEELSLSVENNPITVKAGESLTVPFLVICKNAFFQNQDSRVIQIDVNSDNDYSESFAYKLFGPAN
ncbi:MAG: cytochrome c oxidase accessory protein CcoG [Planctomycetes bacterium]|nr:cytochrome c oxidase accessory protein CcoG [Planctomycetota bacterium]